MELNQSSPPLTSPLPETDGDETCRMEVTSMAIDGVTLLICLCGLLGNGAVLWLLSVHIQRNPITVYIINLAVTDFIFLLPMATFSLLYMTRNASCSAVVFPKYLDLVLLISLFFYVWGLYTLTAVSIERCVSILCSSIRHTRRLSAVVCVLLWALCVIPITTVTSLCLLQSVSLAGWLSSPCTSSTYASLCQPCSFPAQSPPLRSSVVPSSTNPRGSTSLSSSPSSSFSSLGFPSASGVSSSSLATPSFPTRLFSCSPASTAASSLSSTSWWGAAGGTAPWCHSGLPSRGSLKSQKTTRHTATLL